MHLDALPAEQSIIAAIRQLRREGLSIRAIAAQLNAPWVSRLAVRAGMPPLLPDCSGENLREAPATHGLGPRAAHSLDPRLPKRNEEQVSIRLPRALLAWAEKPARKVADDPTHSAVFRVMRAAALRMALLRGVEALEEDLAKKAKKSLRTRSPRRDSGAGESGGRTKVL